MTDPYQIRLPAYRWHVVSPHSLSESKSLGLIQKLCLLWSTIRYFMSRFFFQIGLAVGDIDSIQQNAEFKRLSIKVCSY